MEQPLRLMGEEISMYELLEASLADTGRLFTYMQGQVFGSDFNLKGFDYPWVLSKRTWQNGERVLDVGAGFSELPKHIALDYGCEVWAVDDFGRSEGGGFWERARKPEEFIESNPQVKYVLERLGDREGSSLPKSYFDCIYSASALEHVPTDLAQKVWVHMDELLRPGGEMLHAVDIALPTSRGFGHVMLAYIFDLLSFLSPKTIKTEYMYETPASYLWAVQNSVGFTNRMNRRKVSVIKMVIDPEILSDPPTSTYNRITKDGMKGMRHFRVASLLIHLRKV